MTMFKIGQMRLAWVATFAAALAIVMAFATVDGPMSASAGASCSSQCKADFAACYKDSGGNRSACDEAKTQCLEQCIANGS